MRFGLWTGRGTNARDICWKQTRNLKDDRRGSVGDDEITQILQGGGIMLGVRQEEEKKGMWCVCTIDVKYAWGILRVTGNC